MGEHAVESCAESQTVRTSLPTGSRAITADVLNVGRGREPAQILALQRIVGNRAVGQALRRAAGPTLRKHRALARCGASCTCPSCRGELSELALAEAVRERTSHAAGVVQSSPESTTRVLSRDSSDDLDAGVDNSLPGGLPEAPAPSPPLPPAPPASPSAQPDATPVYLCWSPTEAAPFASHAWIRLTGPEPDPAHETFSLFPANSGVEKADGTTPCAQGVTYRGAKDIGGIARKGKCKPLDISNACVERVYASYPIGKYCAAGPNSNTFAGTIVRTCMHDPNHFFNVSPVTDFSWTGRELLDGDWVPGWKMSPPDAGTFSASLPTVSTADTAGQAFHCPTHDCNPT